MVKLEAGKYYKTRDGRKVGPLEVTRYEDGRGNSFWPLTTNMHEFWDYNGRAWWCNSGGESGSHIVSEWVDYSSCKAAQVDVQREEYGPIRTRPKIIALSGPAGSGKSKAAKYLQNEHGFILVKFAAPLKNMLRAIGLTDRELEGVSKEVPNNILCGQTPRHAMQTLGTEWGRELIGDTFWVDLWSREAARYDRVVCDDCRFDNEAAAVRNMGGIIIGLTGRGGIDGSHVSENGVRSDMLMDNSGDVKKMLRTLDKMVDGVLI